ncbi:Vitamin B12-binding protein [Burkholderiales bacterium]|nr:Vitamin B12-binding protein [Burkholderiales bacterium]
MGAVTLRVALALACAFAAPAPQAARVVDDTGAPVELSAPARRIVTLAPHAAELVAAAGAASRLVGVIAHTDAPAAARALPVVGDVNAIDVERILALAPDLVVTWPWTMPAQVARLRDRGIPVFTTAPRTIDAIAANIERLGALAGTSPEATASAAAFRARLASLEAAVPRGARLRVFYQLSGAPLYTIGAGHTITEAIALCGGENVFASLPVPAPVVNVEEVLALRPQLVVAGIENAVRPSWLDDWRRWEELPAARDEGLAVVDANLLHRPGPRFVEGVAQLCAAVARALPRGRG